MKTTNKKRHLAEQLTRIIGFQGLNDRKNIVDRNNLRNAIPLTRSIIADILKEFTRDEIRSRKLRKGKIESPLDCIKLLRTILRSRDISMGVSTIKTRKQINGKPTSVYKYKLLGC